MVTPLMLFLIKIQILINMFYNMFGANVTANDCDDYFLKPAKTAD